MLQLINKNGQQVNTTELENIAIDFLRSESNIDELKNHMGKRAQIMLISLKKKGLVEVENKVATLTIQEPKQEEKEAKAPGIVAQIIALHKAGKTNKEIIALGFNKSTVGRQVSEYKKKSEAILH